METVGKIVLQLVYALLGEPREGDDLAFGDTLAYEYVDQYRPGIDAFLLVAVKHVVLVHTRLPAYHPYHFLIHIFYFHVEKHIINKNKTSRTLLFNL